MGFFIYIYIDTLPQETKAKNQSGLQSAGGRRGWDVRAERTELVVKGGEKGTLLKVFAQ
jgi:hypothetical protein